MPSVTLTIVLTVKSNVFTFSQHVLVLLVHNICLTVCLAFLYFI